MRFLTCSLLSLAALPAFAHADGNCPAAKESAVVNFPGFDSERDAVQPKHIAALQRCMDKYPICLLLSDGKIVRGASEAQVRVTRKAVVFAFVQHLRTPSRSYCAFATLVPEVGGDRFWSYRTFTPNGGWIGEEVDDQSTHPKTSGETFQMLSKNFKLYHVTLASLLESENRRPEDYGYRIGEKP